MNEGNTVKPTCYHYYYYYCIITRIIRFNLIVVYQRSFQSIALATDEIKI